MLFRVNDVKVFGQYSVILGEKVSGVAAGNGKLWPSLAVLRGFLLVPSGVTAVCIDGE